MGLTVHHTLRSLFVLSIVSVAGLAPGRSATLTYHSPDAGQQLLLRRDGDRLVLVDQQSRAIVASAPAVSTRRVVIAGAANRNDTLTLDLSSPISLPQGIDYDGGARGWDTLVVTGGSVRKETVTQLTPHDGVFDLDGLALRYTNLEPITDTVPAALLTVNGTAGTDTVTITDGPGAGEATISSPTFESYSFANKTNVVFDGLGGDDGVTLNNPATAFNLDSFIIQNVATVEQTGTVHYPSFGVSATGLVNLPLTNDVANIEITTQTGDITYRDVDSVRIGGVSEALSGVRVTGDGSVILQTGDTLTLADTDGADIVRSGATSGNVVLQSDSDIVVTVNNKAIVSPSGLVSVTSGNDIRLGSTGAFDNDVLASGDVTLSAARDIVISGLAEVFSDAFGNGTGGTAAANAGRDFLLTNTLGPDAKFGSNGFGGGTVQVSAPGSVVLTAPSADALASATGPVSVTTSRLIIAPTSGISAQLVSVTSLGTLDLGSTTDAGAGLELSDPEVDRIVTPSLVLEAGNITATQPITFAGELTLRSGATFSASGAGSLNAPTLTFVDLGSSPRTWTVDAATITITPGSAIPYSGVTSLILTGGNAEDTFNVTPTPSTAITLGGRTPDLPTLPGDTLNVNTAGTTSPFLISAPSESGYEGSYTFGNRASITFADVETLNAAADLSISKSDAAVTETPGTPVTYTIVASNNGALGIGNAVVVDSFPPELASISWTCGATAGSTCPASGSGTLNALVNLAPGGTATFTVTATINPAATGTLSNTATVDVPAGTSDPDPANNLATDTDTLLVVTSLATSASGGIALGGQVHDTATLGNGSSPTGTITFNLFGPNDATCAGSPAFTDVAAVSGNGSYPSADFTPAQEGTYRWIASYSGDATNAPVTGACNDSNESVTVILLADLALAKTGPGSVAAGSNISYTITTTNNGPNAARNVTATDTLPAGTTFVSATPTQGSCSGTTTVTCSLGTIANGANATITLVVSTTGATPSSVSNTATVSSTATDPTPGNNSSTANTTVTASADVVVVKTGPGSVIVGNNITYTITASNNGPSAAQNVTVTDTLPAGVTFVSATPSQGGCAGTTTVTCTLGTLNNGASAVVTLVVSTSGAMPSSISNTATVSSTTTDPAPGNNSSTAMTTRGCPTLAATPAVLPPAIAGEPYSQTFTLTNGTAPVNFSLTGTLPAGLSFAGDTLSGVPTGRGAFAVTLEATDANSCAASFPYSVAVSRDRVLAVGAGAGGAAKVGAFGVHSWAPRLDVTAYASPFTGGVSVAQGDTNGDGLTEIVTGAGPGGTPLVRVLNGVTGAERLSFLAYDATMTSGIEVAAGDVNGDGIADIIAVPGYGGPPIVRVFDGLTGAGIRQFFGMPPAWSSGLHVGAGDVNGDGLADIIVGSGPFGPPLVQVFDGAGGALLGQFLAYDSNFQGGVYVAGGDVNGDGFADIVTGPGLGGGPHVRVFDSLTGDQIAGPLGGFFAYNPAFAGGVRVAAGDFDGDGFAEVITGAGPGASPHVRVWDGATGTETFGLYALDASSTAGVFVAGPPAARRMVIDLVQAGGGSPASMRIAGWALEETSATGPGTDAIHAWAYPVGGGPAVFVGAAASRVARADVAAVFGGEFLMSGFDFGGTLASGTYDLVIFVRNDTTLLFDMRRVVRITVP